MILLLAHLALAGDACPLPEGGTGTCLPDDLVADSVACFNEVSVLRDARKAEALDLDRALSLLQAAEERRKRSRAVLPWVAAGSLVAGVMVGVAVSR